MKNLFINLKRTNKPFRYIFFTVLFSYIVSLGFVIKGLLLLTGIETFLRVIAIAILVLILIFYLISGLVFLILKKHKLLLSFIILVFVFTTINLGSSYLIYKTYQYIDDLSKETVIYTTNLIALIDLKKENIKTIGLIGEENDIEGYILPMEYIEANSLNYEIELRDDYLELLEELYSGDLDAIFITENYVAIFDHFEDYEDIDKETYVVDSYSKEYEKEDFTSNRSVTEPFSLLLIGIDSPHENIRKNTGNGDSLMLITFNPKTLSATIFGIPRDTFVPISCYGNKPNKINAAAGHSTKCVIETIQNLVGFDIDYNVKMNFKGLVALVDAMGGIDVEVPVPDIPSEYCLEDSDRIYRNVCLEPGFQTLDGEHALALARVRKAFITSDFRRVQNQQLVLEAIVQKAKTIRNVGDLQKILETISNNMDTNMATRDILGLYNVGKSILTQSNMDDEALNLQKTQLVGYDLTVRPFGYTFQFYQESLDEIVEALLVTLGKKEPTIIKEFSFSINEEYESKIIGKTTGTKKNETLPSFVGDHVSQLDSWNNSRNIRINKTDYISNECTNDIILDQSLAQGTLVSSISALTVSVCRNQGVYQPPTTTTTTTTTTKPPDLPEEIMP